MDEKMNTILESRQDIGSKLENVNPGYANDFMCVFEPTEHAHYKG